MSQSESLLAPERISWALKFGEPARIFYNLVLGAAFFSQGGSTFFNAFGLTVVLVLTAIANLLYCRAYPVDLMIQNSDWRKAWCAWGLLASGLAVALSLERIALQPS
jgi:hypothetical protein